MTKKSQNRPKINILSSEGTPNLGVAVRSFLPMIMDEINENNKTKQKKGKCGTKNDCSEIQTSE